MPFPRLCLLLLAAVLALAGCDAGGNNVDPPADPRLRLEGHLDLAGPGLINTDVWGYFDAGTGRAYALVGGTGRDTTALYVVDVTDPAVPRLTATLGVPGFDMKVWQHFAYTVTGSGDRGGAPEGRILDLSDPARPQVVGAFPSAHNLFIDENGLMYLEFPGLRIFDLKPDPLQPVLLWSDFPQQGHDATVVGTRLYDFHGTDGTRIYDVSTPSAPRLLGAITLPSIRYHHSGWPTGDGAHLFLCDEGARGTATDVTVWDIRDPGNPALVGGITDTTATVHNLYVRDDLAYVAYYKAGFRLYDVSDPAAPRLLDAFDTAPGETGDGFSGAWGAYPFTPSGHVYVSDMQQGLFVFSLVSN